MPRTAPQPAPPPVPSSTHSDLPVPRRGRTAVSMFPNNISNVDPTDYMWVKSHSNHTLCHKVASDVQPTRALFWIVGDIDSHCLSNAQSYDTWSVNIRLSASTNSSLNALLMIGPCKAYTAPARYSILRAKATLKTVLGELLPAEGEDDFAALNS